MKYKILLLIAISFTSLFAFSSHASAATFYYCDKTSDHDPGNLANYYDGADCNFIPSAGLPDFSVDEVFVVSGAIFDNDGFGGQSIFNGSTINEGTVTGDSTFSGDLSENLGTVNGTKTRYYNSPITVTRDFTATGPWTVAADGVAVDITGAIFDGTTTFDAQNGGSFTYLAFSTAYVNGTSLKLVYDHTLDAGSVPATGDYAVTVNGSSATISSVGVSGTNVTLTLASAVTAGDIVELDYVPGINPVRYVASVDASSINNLNVAFGVAVGNTPIYSVALGTTVYVSNSAGNTISVVDSETDTVSATIAVGSGPRYPTPLGTKIYVANSASDNVSVINTLTNTVSSTIPVGDGPSYSLAFGSKIYVINESAGTVSVIDSTTNSNGGTVVSTIPVGNGPSYLIALGTRIYVTNASADTVSVIDTTTNSIGGTVIATISVGDGPFYGVPAGTKIYVSNSNTNTVSVINTLTNTVSSTITVGNGPRYSVVLGTKVYIVNSNAGTVSAINTTTNGIGGTVVATVPVGTTPSYPVVFGTKVYVGNQASGNISVINTATDTVVAAVNNGNNTIPYHSTVLGTKIYTTNFSGSNSVTVIDTEAIESQLPNLVSFTSTTSSGTYISGQTINIRANFGHSLQSGSTMTVALNSGGTATLSTVSSSTLSGTYTVGGSDTTPDLQVSAITSANVTDSTGTYNRTSYDLPSSQGDFEAENSFITRNIGDSKNIVIGDYISITTGSNPYQVSSPINGYVYVANQGSDNVSVIRVSDNTVTDTISVGDEPYGLASASISGMTYLYVANINDDTVSVINTSTNTVIDIVDVGVKPYYVATIGTNIYVTNGASNTVSVIDGNTNDVTDTISVGSYSRGITAYGTDLYVANYGDPNYSGGNYISIINSLTNTVSGTIILPAGSSGPRGITTLGSKVYVANFRSNNVSVIDTASNTITATINVGTGPRGIKGLGTNVYVENFDDGTISIIDTNSNTVTDTIDVGHSPAGMGISGTDIYLSSFQDNKLYILDTTTGELASSEEEEEEDETTGGSHGHSHHSIKVFPVVPETIPVPTVDPLPVPPLHQFNQNLRKGDTSPEVMELQKYLNTHESILTPTGPGSPGAETSFFGPLTFAALIKFQELHSTEILKPVNLTKGTGFFGPSTRAYINSHP